MEGNANAGAGQEPLRIFVSYAREDKKWLTAGYLFNLIPFLADSLRRYNVAFWFDQELKPGDEFKRQIETEIDQARIALLVVSQNFLNSTFIEEREMTHIEERARQGKMIVVPVLVEPCDWSEYPYLADRQMVPTDPLIEYTESEAKWAKVKAQILEGIKAQVKRIREAPVGDAVASIHPSKRGGTDAGANARLTGVEDASQERGIEADSGLMRLKVFENDKDRSQLVLIPEGEFRAGSEEANEGGGSFPVQLSAYYLALHPVTNDQFVRFLNSARPMKTTLEKWVVLGKDCFVRASAKGYESFGGKDDHPVVRVSWFGAKAYCDWAGLRLPSELEWEKGARGTDGREFPWGNQWDATKCRNDKNRGTETTCSVLSYAAGRSPAGLYQMAGNIFEWCVDWYDRNAFNRYKLGMLAPPVEGAVRVLRGGSWATGVAGDFRCAHRHSYEPEYRSTCFGFRCARDV